MLSGGLDWAQRPLPAPLLEPPRERVRRAQGGRRRRTPGSALAPLRSRPDPGVCPRRHAVRSDATGRHPDPPGFREPPIRARPAPRARHVQETPRLSRPLRVPARPIRPAGARPGPQRRPAGQGRWLGADRVERRRTWPVRPMRPPRPQPGNARQERQTRLRPGRAPPMRAGDPRRRPATPNWPPATQTPAAENRTAADLQRPPPPHQSGS
jgi:hypothetical protein